MESKIEQDEVNRPIDIDIKNAFRRLRTADKKRMFTDDLKYYRSLDEATALDKLKTRREIARVYSRNKPIRLKNMNVSTADKSKIADIIYAAMHSNDKWQFRFRKGTHTSFYNLNLKEKTNIEKIEKFYKLFLTEQREIFRYTARGMQGNGSDPEEPFLEEGIDMPQDNLIDPTYFQLVRISGVNQNRLVNGQRFDYFHVNTDIDLTKYQIYKDATEKAKDSNSNTHCLIYALVKNGYTLNSLSYINKQLEGQFPKNNIKKLGLNRNIEFYEIDAKTKYEVKVQWTSPAHDYENDEPIKIAAYKNHYFIYELTNYTAYSSKHLTECLKFNNPHDIIRIDNNRARYDSTKPKISNLRLIHNMYESNLFTKIAEPLTIHEERMRCDYDLSNIDNEQKEFKYVEKDLKDHVVFYADIETDTTGDVHKFLIGGVANSDNDNVFLTKDVQKMFKHIVNNSPPEKEIIVYFHNLKFDFSVIGKDFSIRSSCEKGGALFFVVINFMKRKIVLKDSYKIITTGLANFKDAFDLDIGKKEGINYNIYKRGMNPIVNCDTYASGIKPDCVCYFRQALIDNPEEFKYDESLNTFDCIAYYKYYLTFDCLTLKHGILKMNETIETITDGKTNIFNINTAASFAHGYVSSQGAYEGVCQSSGNLREYLSKAVYGGRVQTNTKYEKKIIDRPIADEDATSLYPSSMKRLKEEIGGIPKGTAKYFRSNIPEDACYYVATVIIHRINKTQDNAFIAIRGKDSINYVNECKDEKVIIDKITLEDYIKFHQIDYTIVEGVYYNEGFNPNIGTIIEKLFTLRKQYKAEGKDTLQETVKLIMNSTYGRTIIKKTNERIVYRWNKTIDEKTNQWTVDNVSPFVYKNFDSIHKPIEQNERWTKIYLHEIDTGFNLAIAGIMILSMSKRIMNEVQGLASDNDLPIYYQDTDSLHMNLEDVPKLEALYLTEYKKVLAGKELGNFHVDFNLNGKKKGVYAKRSIFLGRKCYIDHLVNPETKEEGYHIRMKGVSNPAILHRCDELKIDPFELYTKLISESIEFTLNFDKYNISMEYVKRGVKTRDVGTFKRLISF